MAIHKTPSALHYIQRAIDARTDQMTEGNFFDEVSAALRQRGFKKLGDVNFGDSDRIHGSVFAKPRAKAKPQALVIHGDLLGEYTDLQFGKFIPGDGDYTLLADAAKKEES